VETGRGGGEVQRGVVVGIQGMPVAKELISRIEIGRKNDPNSSFGGGGRKKLHHRSETERQEMVGGRQGIHSG